jgi:hypothetical protein
VIVSGVHVAPVGSRLIPHWTILTVANGHLTVISLTQSGQLHR